MGSFEQRDVKIRAYGDSAVVMGSLELKGTGARADCNRRTWVADANASFSGTQLDRIWLTSEPVTMAA